MISEMVFRGDDADFDADLMVITTAAMVRMELLMAIAMDYN